MFDFLRRHPPTSNASARRRNAGTSGRIPRRDVVQHIAATVKRLQEAMDDQHPGDAPRDVAKADLRDGLTGLRNRAYLSRLARALAQDRAGTPLELCVLCVDLDDFKPVNERFGPGVGDDTLRQVGARLCRAARGDDIVFRLGGDEFLILAPCPVGEGAAVARLIATRLLTDLGRPFDRVPRAGLRIGACVGAALWRQGRGPLTEAIGHAGEALYAAKRAGRGQFRHYASRLVDRAPAAGKTTAAGAQGAAGAGGMPSGPNPGGSTAAL